MLFVGSRSTQKPLLNPAVVSSKMRSADRALRREVSGGVAPVQIKLQHCSGCTQGKTQQNGETGLKPPD